MTTQHAIDDGYPPVPEELVINDPEAFKALSNPLRLKLMHILRSAASVTEIADHLDVPKTRLYYHINALVEAGVIEVIDRRKVGTQIENIYRITGLLIRPGADIWSATNDPYDFAEVAAAVVVDPARADLVEAMALNASGGFDLDRVNGTLGRSIAALPVDKISEFSDRILDLVRDMSESEDDDGILVGFTYVLLPVDPNDAVTDRKDAS